VGNIDAADDLSRAEEASKQSTTVGRARVADACGEFSFLFDATRDRASNLISDGDRRVHANGKAARHTSRSRSVGYSYESPTRDRPDMGESTQGHTWGFFPFPSLMNGPYRAPHPDSEVNSLWSMEQWDQGKSATSMRNFGRSIGSKG